MLAIMIDKIIEYIICKAYTAVGSRAGSNYVIVIEIVIDYAKMV